MSRRISVLLTVLLLALSLHSQNSDRVVRSRIADYFKTYQPPIVIGDFGVASTVIDHSSKTVTVTMTNPFSRIMFRESYIDSLLHDMKSHLPSAYRKYGINVISNGKDIRSLVPNRYRTEPDQSMLWGGTRYHGKPLTINESAAYRPTRGLAGTHLSVTPSHGYYYDDKNTNGWKWQRPPLWGTCEDLLVQDFTYRYIIPMLENAGAIVSCTRERDWQTYSAVIDNASDRKHFHSTSHRGNRWQTIDSGGYSLSMRKIVRDKSATTDIVECSSDRTTGYASASWMPDIPQDGQYAVYVTYHSTARSVTDARYTVHHSGGETTFLVNQQIGDRTWIYLGTFHFRKGHGDDRMVVLENLSDEEGCICADAVRFGAGIGEESPHGITSGKPRYLEGAKYYALYNGAPDSVTSFYNNMEEYKEDIQVRPRMTDWLSGGSVFNPGYDGLGIPIELSVAVHTDAGKHIGNTIYGTLGICTTQMKDGILGTGMTRDVSRDITDQILSEMQRDITAATGREWTLRGILDDNFCETREPLMPSTLIEMLSHQNFYDIRYAYDPDFRFTVARSIYKGILKYISYMHSRTCTVQPLPVDHFMIATTENEGCVRLSWKAVNDPIEPSAKADGYIIYTSIDGRGFDNGRLVHYTQYETALQKGHIYSFKVTAVNNGGQSMPSETLSACISGRSRSTILIVNGFQRLSGPAVLDTPDCIGFDLSRDEGVQYVKSPILCGYQKVFQRSHFNMEDEEELGFSGTEFDGEMLAGNSFNYPYTHGAAIASGTNYSFVSCSREALEDGMLSLSDYDMADFIFGLQKQTPGDTLMGHCYSTFTPELIRIVSDYHNQGGKILISGSYIGTDLYTSQEGRNFAKDVLGINWSGSTEDGYETAVKGLGGTYYLNTESDSEMYRLRHPDIIEPCSNAIPIFAYADSRYCAGVAKRGIITTGFPFESIKGEKQRTRILSSLIDYLCNELAADD
ncbi:MAG: N-acetylmuramoyl-L-alanine amidase [Bacteroidaceae bacterium]|nr:N-acetylmuramoyl-L-alanine amidase [Bacteroidaceae bacterium]